MATLRQVTWRLVFAGFLQSEESLFIKIVVTLRQFAPVPAVAFNIKRTKYTHSNS